MAFLVGVMVYTYIPALKRIRQEDCHRFEATLEYRVRSYLKTQKANKTK